MKKEQKTWTISEIVADPKFEELLISEMNRRTTQYNRIKAGLKHNQRMRRTTYIRLVEAGKFNPDYIVREYAKIIERTSYEPSVIRAYIIELFSLIVRQVREIKKAA